MTRPEAMRRAQELYESGEWTLTRICEHLACHGIQVHRRTVKRWADPVWAETDRSRQRAGHRSRTRATKRAERGSSHPRVIDADAIIRRIRTLHEAGLDYPGIRIVIAVDYKVRVSRKSVQHAVERGELPERLDQIVRRRAAGVTS